MKRAIIGSVFALTLILGGASYAHAANLTGWAWSETFGWISFNSSDSGAGGGPYSVTVDGSTGNMGGYAWSPNAGWISFQSSDGSLCGGAANLSKSTGAVTGFARMISLGGTDGCIELSGTNHASPDLTGNGGVTYDQTTGVFKGWAWGGDSSAHLGTGWIQFNATTGTPGPVSCISADCGYSSNITGSCTRSPSDAHFSSTTDITFTATPTSGTGPYQYNWNSSGYVSNNQFTATYSNSAVGPIVVMKDVSGLTTNNVSCPAVSIILPLTPHDIQTGVNATVANSNTITVKQVSPFAIVYNFTLTDDYTCSPTLTSSNGSNTNGGYPGWDTYWNNITLTANNNGDGTITWTGNTGTNLKAGTAAQPVTPDIYTFGITCTSNKNATQGVHVFVKVNSSSVKEI